ncbi:MAG: hypothetical protein IPJ26_08740 [Bacteroidetes bacterium]|nr:hypothetical protein [Bacteroidota bacterium]
MFKTGNNGQSWTYTGYSVGSSISLNHLYSSGNTLWASTSVGVYKSIDGGATFNSASNNIPFSAEIYSLVAKGDTAYCGTSNGTYYTTNGGLLWNLITITGLGNPIYTRSWQIIGSTVYAGLITVSILHLSVKTTGAFSALDFTIIVFHGCLPLMEPHYMPQL